MATILNVDASKHVVDVTVSSDDTGAPERLGCTHVVLTDAQAAALLAAQAKPNGGLTWDGATFGLLPVPVAPVAANPNQPLIDAITADPATIDPNIMAVALITALGGMPPETITSAASTSATMATISLAQPATASPATG